MTNLIIIIDEPHYLIPINVNENHNIIYIVDEEENLLNYYN